MNNYNSAALFTYNSAACFGMLLCNCELQSQVHSLSSSISI